MAPTRNQFGTIGGVFTPCILTILGVIMYMRAGFVVGEAGILGALAILLVAKSITVLTAISTSAIGTNMRVKGGGAYFLISRVLGNAFGGAIGLLLFLAQAVSVPFYLIGFTEAVVRTFPALQPHFLYISLGTGLALFIIAYVGAGWAIKMQYVIMGVLFASVAVFLGGAALLFSPARFVENLGTGFTAMAEGGSLKHSFWSIFAIYFPAVTGIMAGINMSGDLKNPAKSIPLGTIAAIGVGGAVYMGQILLCGAAFPREELIEKPYLLLQSNALFGAGWLVTAGVFAATLSSALGSILGAPRVLQAIARDRIVPVLNPFRKGSPRGDEPRRATFLVGLMTLGVLFWAANAPGGQALNIVAGVITEFFLYTYGTLNLAAFVEGAGANPSFRPQFRWFHWGSALAGGLGCVAVAFIISPVEAAVAFGILSALIYWIKRRELKTTHGDAWRGLLYGSVRNSLVWLARMKESPKNWRPTILVLTGDAEKREGLTRAAVWLAADRGLVFLARVLVGTFERYAPRRATAAAELMDFCEEHDMDAFPVVVIDEDADHGLNSVLQSVSLGPIRPSMAAFGWPRTPEEAQAAERRYRMAHALDMSVLVVRAGEAVERIGERSIDVWWHRAHNGALMVLLAHLLRCNPEWSRAKIRLIRAIRDAAGRESTLANLREALATARVTAEPVVLVSEAPLADLISRMSSKADAVFMGFALDDDPAPPFPHAVEEAEISPDAMVVLVWSAGDMDLDA